MIRVRCSPNEYEVAGSPAELRSVAERLRRLAVGGLEEVIACEASFDPRPYDSVLLRLKIVKNEEKDRVSIRADELVLSGSAAGLLRFASFFDAADDAPNGDHVHHEYFDSNDYVAPGSLALVVMVERKMPNQMPDRTPPSGVGHH